VLQWHQAVDAVEHIVGAGIIRDVRDLTGACLTGEDKSRRHRGLAGGADVRRQAIAGQDTIVGGEFQRLRDCVTITGPGLPK
jgi:hypothetical protein